MSKASSKASSASKSPTTFDDIPNNVKRLILSNTETAKAMRASTKKYADLLNTNFNNKYWLKEYLADKFSKDCKKTGITYNLQLIPSEKSKLPTLDIEARTYCTGASLLRIKNGTNTLFTKISPVRDENKNPNWYAPSSYWPHDDENKNLFTNVLKNLSTVKVPSAEKTDLIKSWNKILSTKNKL